MSLFPSTNLALLKSIVDDTGPQLGWQNFVKVYSPTISRWLRRRGLQHTDADDCTQQVLVAVMRSISTFRDDGRPASFRRWLQRVVKNELINTLRKNARSPIPGGDMQIFQSLADQLATNAAASDWIELEYQRSLFTVAAEEVRSAVEAKTWQAFWKSQVDGLPTSTIAEELQMSIGAVYVAKGRVLQRLQSVVRQLEEME